jgi:predicted small metal-binding protein
MNGWSADLKQVCGCALAATGNNAGEITAKVTKHAAETHGMSEVPAEIVQKLQAAMRPTM